MGGRLFLSILLVAMLASCQNKQPRETASVTTTKPMEEVWTAPDTATLDNSEASQQIKYGRQLVCNTSAYLGPHGTVAKITNGMNCQNCHLNAGTVPFGNNYAAVYSTYPKFRERSGSVENIYKRVNDCIERSLNGKALDSSTKEMQAFKAYIEWVGKDVPKGTKPNGAGITELAYLDQSADTAKGKIVFEEKCRVCHGDNGEGKLTAFKDSYQYPPLWGPNSYTVGAGLYRVSRFAGYVKSNMPYGINYQHPVLTDEEAWNVAAFVNSQPRPKIDISKDWPNKAGKPFDHPYGPYADTFSQQQHKYGPFLPIVAYKKEHDKKQK